MRIRLVLPRSSFFLCNRLVSFCVVACFTWFAQESAKQNGVLVPVAKLPAFVDKMEAVVRASSSLSLPACLRLACLRFACLRLGRLRLGRLRFASPSLSSSRHASVLPNPFFFFFRSRTHTTRRARTHATLARAPPAHPPSLHAHSRARARICMPFEFFSSATGSAARRRTRPTTSVAWRC